MKKNIKLIQTIEESISRIPVKLGVNKTNELVRLIYEISKRDASPPSDVFKSIGLDQIIQSDRGNIFNLLKERLIWLRYPSFEKEKTLQLMPLKMKGGLKECCAWPSKIEPEKIFIEKNVAKYDWVNSFIGNFPDSNIIEIDTFKDGLNTFDKVDLIQRYADRCKSLFLVKNKDAFIKICPCTKDCHRCGYWVLNIGFGCPIDCSYCFLQSYSNSPGLILPANIEEYYEYIKDFDDKVHTKTRIGTGEFTDSLALDKYTAYSSYLIPFFKDVKNLVLELKTKIKDIDAVITQEPNDNVVISWSVNTSGMVDKYEKGSASIRDRIEASCRAAQRGYKIGFHFDPLIYHKDWESSYKNIVGEIFSRKELKDKIVWVSLGTLRYTPGLKQTAEQRFKDNKLYYDGEFFIDFDGKFRYPREIRIEMYNKMIKWIRNFDKKSWVYLCMEPEEVWRSTNIPKEHYYYRNS